MSISTLTISPKNPPLYPYSLQYFALHCPSAFSRHNLLSHGIFNDDFSILPIIGTVDLNYNPTALRASYVELSKILCFSKEVSIFLYFSKVCKTVASIITFNSRSPLHLDCLNRLNAGRWAKCAENCVSGTVADPAEDELKWDQACGCTDDKTSHLSKAFPNCLPRHVHILDFKGLQICRSSTEPLDNAWDKWLVHAVSPKDKT